MMMVCKRGRTYRIEGFISGKRVRLSLGTRTADHAHVLVNRIERALSEGSLCSLWPQLRAVLPPQTFHVLAALVGWAEPHEKPEPTWAELLAAFECWMAQRKALNRLQSSTAERYRQTLSEFTMFLAERNLSNLRDITRPIVESFKVWRAQRIMKQQVRPRRNLSGARCRHSPQGVCLRPGGGDDCQESREDGGEARR